MSKKQRRTGAVSSSMSSDALVWRDTGQRSRCHSPKKAPCANSEIAYFLRSKLFSKCCATNSRASKCSNSPSSNGSKGLFLAPSRFCRTRPSVHETRRRPSVHETRRRPSVHETRRRPSVHETRRRPSVHETRRRPGGNLEYCGRAPVSRPVCFVQEDPRGSVAPRRRRRRGVVLSAQAPAMSFAC